MRALKAARAAGLEVRRYEITAEKIVIVTANGDALAEASTPLERWKNAHARQA
jgi:hypothetical protein